MKKEITPRIKRLLQLHGFFAILNAILAIVAGVYVSYAYYDVSPLSIVGGLVISFLTINFLNFVASIFLATFFYTADTGQELKDAVWEEPEEIEDEEMFTEVSIKIIDTPEKAIGTYMDTQFFEWLDIEDLDKNVKRFWFSGTVNMQHGLNNPLPDGTFMIPPGILYNLEAPT